MLYSRYNETKQERKELIILKCVESSLLIQCYRLATFQSRRSCCYNCICLTLVCNYVIRRKSGLLNGYLYWVIYCLLFIYCLHYLMLNCLLKGDLYRFIYCLLHNFSYYYVIEAFYVSVCTFKNIDV